MAKELRIGDRVSWQTSQGRTHGVIVGKATGRMKIKEFEVHATPEDPRYVVRSDKSGEEAAHAARALRKLKP